jgi:hypothetical protein
MDAEGSKKAGKISLSDGGTAGQLRPSAEVELERAVRAFLFAMQTRRGTLVSRNVANVCEGITQSPVRMIVRRIKEARRARNHQHNYPLAKAIVAELDRYVDREFGTDAA